MLLSTSLFSFVIGFLMYRVLLSGHKDVGVRVSPGEPASPCEGICKPDGDLPSEREGPRAAGQHQQQHAAILHLILFLGGEG